MRKVKELLISDALLDVENGTIIGGTIKFVGKEWKMILSLIRIKNSGAKTHLVR